MTNIPNNDILSLEMKQKYPKSSNGTTIIKYHISYMLADQKELVKLVYYYLPSFLNFDDHCNTEDVFKIYSEGQFFVKASSYPNHEELAYGRALAIEDNFRYNLFHNKITLNNCPNIQNISNHLASDYNSFYQSFVLEGKSITELYEAKHPNSPSLSELNIAEMTPETRELIKTPDSQTIAEFNKRIKYSLKVFFESNANIIFLPTDYEEQANLVIFPSLQEKERNGLAADIPLFQDNQIQKMYLVLPIVSKTLYDVSLINDYAHGLTHIFLDHPCENYYPCSKGEVQARTLNIEYLTTMSQRLTLDIANPQDHGNETQIIQSLLPWDIAAIRHGYGMPTPQNVTYILNDNLNLEEIFSVKLYNNTLVTFSSTGYNIVNLESVNNYAVDLRYDHLSNVTNSEISLKFLLSYDTEIAEVSVNGPGKIVLNPDVATQINISGENNNISLSENTEACFVEISGANELIQICNYDSSLHSITYI